MKNCSFHLPALMLLLLSAVPAPSHADEAQEDVLSTLSHIDMPLLSIETEGHANPTFTVVYPPEGCWGVGITDNENVPGRMVMTLKGDVMYDSGEYEKGKSGMRIKARGNTSAACAAQTPYKLKLSKKADLMLRDDKALRDKDWVLLSPRIGTGALHTMFGLELASFVGKPWEPEYRYVNVVLNGEYRGVYILTESVGRGDRKIDVYDSGFIVENDAYWWNEGDDYFKTDLQDSHLGYTYKYPDADDMTDSIRSAMQTYVNAAEKALWSDATDVSEYFDYKSFAASVLSYDLLGNVDVGGTNMYYVKKDLLPDAPTSTALEAGPLWDFGGIFKVADDTWSLQHTDNITYYPQLFKRKAFVDEYVAAFDAVKPGLMSHMRDVVDAFVESTGKALDESIALHNRVYPQECIDGTVSGQAEQLLVMLQRRIGTVDSLIQCKYSATAIEAPKYDGGASGAQGDCGVVDLAGRQYGHVSSAMPKGIYVVRQKDGSARKVIK